MLLSYQHSPDAFHCVLPFLPGLVMQLKQEVPLPVDFLSAVSMLSYAMMYRFPGYPLLYAPVLERYGFNL